MGNMYRNPYILTGKRMKYEYRSFGGDKKDDVRKHEASKVEFK